MKSPFDQLLQQPEGKTLEFKRDLSSPRNVLRTLVAFANAAGRHLVIGVDEDRRVGPESGLATKISQYLSTQMTAGKAELTKALGHVSVSSLLHRQIR